MIEQIIILSMTTIAICSTTWPGMLLNKPADWIESKIGVFLSKPLFSCYVCATIWYSAVICLVVGWPVWYAVPAMGVSAVVSMLQND